MWKLKQYYSLLTQKLSGKHADPQFTRKDWIWKCINLFVCAVGMDYVGQKLLEMTVDASLAHRELNWMSFDYMYYLGIQGIFMGMALWKLFEMYWWANNSYNKIKKYKQTEKSLDCDVNVI